MEDVNRNVDHSNKNIRLLSFLCYKTALDNKLRKEKFFQAIQTDPLGFGLLIISCQHP